MLLFLARRNKRKQLAVLRLFGEQLVGANCKDKQPEGEDYIYIFLLFHCQQDKLSGHLKEKPLILFTGNSTLQNPEERV